MTRRRWLGTALAGSACARRPEDGPALLPPTVAGAWQRAEMREEPAPGARRVLHARYEGPGTVRVDLYDLASSATALDMAQRRPPAPDTVFFYQGHYFAVVKWERADRDALRQFVRELEKTLARPAR